MKVQIFQNETCSGIFDTYKIILPDGQEIVNQDKNQTMNIDCLDQYVGETVVHHVYNGLEHIVSEEVTLKPSMTTPFGGKVPLFDYDENEGCN
jgi:hypothetical protein